MTDDMTNDTGVVEGQSPNTDAAMQNDVQPTDVSVDVSEIQAQLAAANKAKDAAEKALTLEKQAHSKLKREHMSEAEVLAEQKKEVEDKARMYDRQMSAMAAEKILVKAGISGDDYESLLGLIVSEDSERTEAAAQEVVDMLSRLTKLAVKAEREKILQETPTLPAGGDKEQADPFVEAFTKG